MRKRSSKDIVAFPSKIDTKWSIPSPDEPPCEIFSLFVFQIHSLCSFSIFNFVSYFGQIAVRSPIVNSKKNVTITAQNGICEDLVVTWKIHWDRGYGTRNIFKTFMNFTATLHLNCNECQGITFDTCSLIFIRLQNH